MSVWDKGTGEAVIDHMVPQPPVINLIVGETAGRRLTSVHDYRQVGLDERFQQCSGQGSSSRLPGPPWLPFTVLVEHQGEHREGA